MARSQGLRRRRTSTSTTPQTHPIRRCRTKAKNEGSTNITKRKRQNGETHQEPLGAITDPHLLNMYVSLPPLSAASAAAAASPISQKPEANTPTRPNSSRTRRFLLAQDLLRLPNQESRRRRKTLPHPAIHKPAFRAPNHVLGVAPTLDSRDLAPSVNTL